MKKLMLVLGVGMLMSFSLNSCSKCAECSGSNSGLDGIEYCKGNAAEDIVYNAAEASCEASGGTFK